MDKKIFEELWEKQKKLDIEACRAFWNNRAEEFNQNVHQTKNGNRMEKLIRLFLDRGMINKNSRVLDIGCGPGKHAMEFASLTKEVMGLDISPRMLELAEKNAADRRASNTSFKLLNWEEADLHLLGWEKKFDLVMAANCPGVHNIGTLEKMIDASTGYCYIRQFVSREDSLKDELALFFGRGKSAAHTGTGFYAVFNILWLMGHFPETGYEDAEWEHQMTVDEAFRYYSGYFEMSQKMTDDEKKILRNKLEERVKQEGCMRDRVKAKFGWILWKV